jgi:hypothetical protein
VISDWSSSLSPSEVGVVLSWRDCGRLLFCWLVLEELSCRFRTSSCSFSQLMPPRRGEGAARSIGLLLALTTSLILCWRRVDGVRLPLSESSSPDPETGVWNPRTVTKAGTWLFMARHVGALHQLEAAIDSCGIVSGDSWQCA